MKTTALSTRTALSLALGMSLAVGATSALAKDSKATPRIEKRSVTLHGYTFDDNYGWMSNLDDPMLEPFVRNENARVNNGLKGDLKDQLAIEFKELLAPSQSLAEYLDDHGFRPRLRKGRQNTLPIMEQDEAFYRQNEESLTSPDGSVSMEFVSDSGSDLKVVRFKDNATGHYLADTLTTKFSFGPVEWLNDNKTVVYFSDRDGRVGNHYPVLRAHTLGTKQNQDKVIYEAPTADTWVSVMRTPLGYYIIRQQDDNTWLNAFDYESGVGKLIFEKKNVNLGFQGIGNGQLLFKSYEQAPMGKIVGIDPSTGKWTTLIPEAEHNLDSYTIIGKYAYISYIKDTAHVLYRYDMESGAFTQVELPGLGSIRLSPSSDGTHLMVAFQNYHEPMSMWKLPVAATKLEMVSPAAKTAIPLESRRVFYRAHNGKQVPIWLVMKKGTKLSPTTPIYLYGYGGFRINIMPRYQKTYLPFYQRGGVQAVVTLPGGMEYGEAWHKAGYLSNKQNVFDDFAVAGRYLVDQGWTSPKHIALGGGSNGGLLAAATATIYPDNFGVSVPEVGVLDMVDYQLHTGGKWWVSEYGDRYDAKAFQTLYLLSPYHNIKKRAYPHTLVMTADLDDRVVASHSYKYAAKLQAHQHADRRAWLYTARGASHGASSTGTMASRVNYLANKFAFILTYTR